MTRRTHIFRNASIALLLLLTGCGEVRTPDNTLPAPQSLPTVELPVAGKLFTVQVADDAQERAIGLMHVRSMPIDRGMLFVFPDEAPLSFWMRDTLIDLDIIYVSASERIVSTHTMRAHDLTGVPSDAPAKYAIELNAGLAQKLRLTPGDALPIPTGATDSVR